MSRFLQRLAEEPEEHDVSKELFLGIMMLMLCLGILLLNVAQPVWRVHRHDPVPGDAVVVYSKSGPGLSRDGYTVVRPLDEAGYQALVRTLVSTPDRDLHLFLRGGSRQELVRHAALADSLLSTDTLGRKVRPAVFVHTW